MGETGGCDLRAVVVKFALHPNDHLRHGFVLGNAVH